MQPNIHFFLNNCKGVEAGAFKNVNIGAYVFSLVMVPNDDVDVELSAEVAALVPGLHVRDIAPIEQKQDPMPAVSPPPIERPEESQIITADITPKLPEQAESLPLLHAPIPTAQIVPRHIVVCVSTGRSVQDYVYESKFFAAGDVRWSGTKGGKECVGDRFAFINAAANLMEVFAITAIHSTPSAIAAMRRPHWRAFPRVLILGPKLGEVPFTAMYATFRLYNTSPQGVSRWRWNGELEAMIR